MLVRLDETFQRVGSPCNSGDRSRGIAIVAEAHRLVEADQESDLDQIHEIGYHGAMNTRPLGIFDLGKGAATVVKQMGL